MGGDDATVNLGVLGALGVVWLALAASVLARPRGSRSGQRAVSPVTTAAAVCGENVCALALVVLTAVVYSHGLHVLWLVVAVGVGFVLFAVLVAGPLRRSRAFSLADFVEWRLKSRKVRRIATCCVVAFCLCLLVAQFRFVGDVVEAVAGWSAPYAWIVLSAVTLVILRSGRPGAGAGFQSVGFWLKFLGFTIPALVLLGLWVTFGGPTGTEHGPGSWASLAIPSGTVLTHYSVAMTLVFGVVGLPLFVFRYYGTRDVASARDSVTVTFALIASMLVLPFVFAVLAHFFAPSPSQRLGETTSMMMFFVPQWVAPGGLGLALTGLLLVVAAVSTVAVVVALSSAVGSHVSQCLTGGGMRLYGMGAISAVLLPPLLICVVPPLRNVDILVLVLAGFHICASTLAPVLLLGVWWRGLTPIGAGAAMIVGLVLIGLTAVVTLWDPPMPDALRVPTIYPGLTTLPVVVLVAVGFSLAFPRNLPKSAATALATLHGGVREPHRLE